MALHLLRAAPAALLAAALLLHPAAPAQTAGDGGASGGDPVSAAHAALGVDYRTFDEHVVTLSNPFMEGRIPGSRGMEMASQYCEYWFAKAGVEPAFPEAGGSTPWRQPFRLGSRRSVAEQSLSAGSETFRAGVDFVASTLGGGGAVQAPVVFVGYGIDDGNDDFTSFDDAVDLEGRIVLAFRFEPMDDRGRSRWTGDDSWSRHAGYQRKMSRLNRRNVAAVVFVNPPGCADPRAGELAGASGRGRGAPVLHLTADAGARLVRALGGTSSLAELRAIADAGGRCLPLPQAMSLEVTIDEQQTVAENVGALLRGRGALADQMIVIGAHLDHLGMGEFGSRRGGGSLHPGADDNASGTAAILMLADKLRRSYDELPTDTPLRTVLFLAFSAEESGLNGSRYYVDNPLVPLSQHAVMINFDMIGRITNKRLSVSGAHTANGMKELLQPLFDASGLDIVQPRGIMAASDHAAFYAKRVPVLFGIIAEFHDDYHTPDDVSWKINRADGVLTVNLFHQVALALSRRTEPFEFQR